MPAAKRPKREPTDDWDQLRLWVTSPEQETYELLRPIVLYGRTPAVRAAETGTPERTLRRRAERFEQRGMASLFETVTLPTTDRRKLPEDIRRAILALKAEYARLTANEIATICRHRFDRPVHRRTVQRLLTTALVPTLVGRRYPTYHVFPDPVERRLAIVRLYIEGWSVTSIAGYLATTRARIYETLRRWYEEGVPGLEDHSRAPKHPARKVDLKTLAAIRRLQSNPELGEFRIHAALEQQGIHLSPRTCGRILALHRELYGLAGPAPGELHETQAMPFAATRRHQWWSVDVRYIEDHALPTSKPVYLIGVLDNYSRALVASLVSPRQDLTAYLIVLREAMLRHGVPEGIVSDGWGIFRAKDAQRIYQALGITKRQIDSAQAWQNYIETAFNVQRRMADYHFAQATTWAELEAVHARYFHDYNHQAHFAHQHRPAGRRSPARVLGFIQGGWCEPAELNRLFRLRAERRIDAGGYVRFRHWRLYGERGLAGQAAAVWVIGEHLAIEHATTTLSAYEIAYAPGGHRFREVTNPRSFDTGYRSSQPFLAPLDELPWQLAYRVSAYAPRRPRGTGRQLRLFPAEDERQSAAS